MIYSLDYIQLDSEPYGYCTHIINVSENYITGYVQNENTVKLFDRKTGKFLCKIGDRGNGQGEYTQFNNVYISKDEKNVFLHTYPANKEIRVYGIDGAYQSSIPVTYNEKMNVSSFYVDNDAKRVVLAFSSLAEDAESILIVQDFEGNVIQSIDVSV